MAFWGCSLISGTSTLSAGQPLLDLTFQGKKSGPVMLSEALSCIVIGITRGVPLNVWTGILFDGDNCRALYPAHIVDAGAQVGQPLATTPKRN